MNNNSKASSKESNNIPFKIFNPTPDSDIKDSSNENIDHSRTKSKQSVRYSEQGNKIMIEEHNTENSRSNNGSQIK